MSTVVVCDMLAWHDSIHHVRHCLPCCVLSVCEMSARVASQQDALRSCRSTLRMRVQQDVTCELCV